MIHFRQTGGSTWTITGSGSGSTQHRVTLLNNSDLTICYVYFSAPGSTVLGNDWLGSSEVIAPNTTREFFIDAGTYDFYAQDCNHDQIDLRGSVVVEGNIDWNIYQREP